VTKPNQESDHGGSVRSRFLGDVAVRFLGQAVHALKGLIFLPLIARSFGESAYGIWAQISLTVVLLQPLLTLRMDSALVRYLVSASKGAERKQALAFVNSVVCVSGTILLLLAWAFRDGFSLILFGQQSLAEFAAPLAGLLVAQATLSVSVAYFRALGQLKLCTAIQVGSSIGSIAVVTIAVQGFGANLHQAVIAWAISTGLSSIIARIFIARNRGAWSVRIHQRTARRFLRYGLPLIPAAVAAWIIEYSDRYFVVHMLGLGDAGIYTGAYRLAQIMRMLMAPLAFVLLPTILRLRKSGEDPLARSLTRDAHSVYLLVACGIAPLLIVWGPQVLASLASESFRVSQSLLALLVIGELLLSLRMLYTQLLFLSERTAAVMLVIGGTALMNVAANLMLIPMLGLLGAALATAISYATQWLIMLRLVQDRDALSLPFALLVRAFVGGALVYVLLCLTESVGTGGAILGIVVAPLLYFSVIWTSKTTREPLLRMSTWYSRK